MVKPLDYISCCGAYCKTCRQYVDGFCKGCKLDSDNGKRDINRAKCKIKICCFKEKKLISCADCEKFSNCKIFNTRFKIGTRNNKKYQESLTFIKEKGYDEFLLKAKKWKDHTGKLN